MPVLLLSLPELSSCWGRRHDRRPSSARLQPEGGVRAPGALLPGSAGGAWEQAAPQHRRPALGSRAQQAAPPKGASGGLEGQKGERLEGLRGLGAGRSLCLPPLSSVELLSGSFLWSPGTELGSACSSVLHGLNSMINAGCYPGCFRCIFPCLRKRRGGTSCGRGLPDSFLSL